MPDRSLPPELANLPHDWDEDCGCLVFGAMQSPITRPILKQALPRDFEALTMTFTALHEIEAGEEITIDYGSPVSPPPRSARFRAHSLCRRLCSTNQSLARALRAVERRHLFEDMSLHEEMLADPVRLAAYHEAI